MRTGGYNRSAAYNGPPDDGTTIDGATNDGAIEYGTSYNRSTDDSNTYNGTADFGKSAPSNTHGSAAGLTARISHRSENRFHPGNAGKLVLF